MVSELEARSLSSRNTLGDTTHNTNKMGQVAEVGGGYADDMVEALGNDAKIPKI